MAAFLNHCFFWASILPTAAIKSFFSTPLADFQKDHFDTNKEMASSCTLLATLQASSHCSWQQPLPTYLLYITQPAACIIAACPRPLDVLVVLPPFLQQLPIPFQALAVMEFFYLPSEHQSYGTSLTSSTIMLAIVNQVHVAKQCIWLTTVHILLFLNLPILLDPKGRTMNGESVMSASQIMVKQ